MMGPKKGWGRG